MLVCSLCVFRSYIEKVSYPHYLEVLHVQGKIKLYSLHSYLKNFVQVLSCRVIITIEYKTCEVGSKCVIGWPVAVVVVCHRVTVVAEKN